MICALNAKFQTVSQITNLIQGKQTDYLEEKLEGTLSLLDPKHFFTFPHFVPTMYEILDFGIVGLGPLHPAIWEVVYCFVAVQHWPVQPVGITVQDFLVNNLVKPKMKMVALCMM